MKSSVYSLKEINQCPICSSSKRSFIAERKDNIPLVECDNCSLIYVSHLPENISTFYKDTYLDSHDNNFLKWFSNDFYWVFSLIDTLINHSNRKNIKNNALDIGCSNGSLLELFKENGYKTFGIDLITRNITNACSKGLNVALGNIESYDFKDRKFQIITALKVLDHFRDINLVLHKILDLLDEDGVFFFHVPITDKSLFIKYGNNYHWLHHSLAHTVYFTEKSLNILINSFFPNTFYNLIYHSIKSNQEKLDYICYARKNQTNMLFDSTMYNVLSNNNMDQINNSIPIEYYLTKALVDANFNSYNSSFELLEQLKERYCDSKSNDNIIKHRIILLDNLNRL